MLSPNLRAFLDMIAWSEIGPALLAVSDNGYNVIVGSTPDHPILFTDYSRHPHRVIDLGRGLKSSAAGRGQILGVYADAYMKQLNLPDFGHDSQDAIIVQMIRECHALDAIEQGHIAQAIAMCSSRWASLPGAGYGQHENKLNGLVAAYESAGGALA